MGYNSDKDEKSKIVLNRKMRMWNKYKTYIIGLVAILVVIIVFSLILKSCGKKNDKKNTERTTIDHNAVEEETTTAVIETPTQPVTEATTAAAKNNTFEVSGTAVSQEFTNENAFKNSVFIGDFIASGISGYGYLDDAKVISNNAMTSDKLSDRINDITSRNPESVFVMVGLNDLNYGTRTPDDIYDYVAAFVGKLQKEAPGVKVYIVSTMPVSRGYNNSSRTIKQSDIDALNETFKTKCVSIGASYIDVANSFKDGGYLGNNYTDSGYNIRNAYYPFILNGIAGVVK